MRHLANRTPKITGFTLVEILIVVVIIGILAVIVLPQFTNAAAASRENSMKMDLFRIRSGLEVYKQQHNGNYPTLATFEQQMTMSSTADGTTAAPYTDGFPFGPYLRFIPQNRYTNSDTIGNGAVGSSDWYYNENTGAFHANDSAAS